MSIEERRALFDTDERGAIFGFCSFACATADYEGLRAKLTEFAKPLDMKLRLYSASEPMRRS